VDALPTLAAVEAVPALPVADFEIAQDFARAEKAPATRLAYRSDFDLFRAWCQARHVPFLPAAPDTVAAFLAAEASRGIKPSSIGRRVAAIRYAHKLAGHDAPPTNSEMVRATVRGIRRSVGAATVRKAPILAETARAMAQATPDTLKGVRDRALLLLGFAGAFRRSELVALDVADLEETEDGLRVIIRRSKTDQEGQGQTIAIVRGSAACPVKAVKAWLAAAAITDGPPFRPAGNSRRISDERLSARSVADTVKAYARHLGLNVADFSAHSLRSGFLTSAARRGASVFKMRDVSRHKSMDVLQAYVRDADLFRDHAGAGLL
jgi:site-specific recombinase XerD